MFMFLSAWQDHTNVCILFMSSSNLVLCVQFSHTNHWMFNMAPHGKELSEDLRIRIVALHKVGLGYKKFGNSRELSYSKGRSKKLSPCAVRQVQKLASKNRHMSAASIVLEVAEEDGQLVRALTICHTLQQVSLHGRSPRGKPLLKPELLEPCLVVWWV